MAAPKKYRRALVWMRRAMRVDDNAVLWHAAQDAEEVVPLLVLTDESRYARETPRRRVLRQAIVSLDEQLRAKGMHLHIRVGNSTDEVATAAQAYGARVVYAARVYDEPGLQRERELRKALGGFGVEYQSLKDRVLKESQEVRSGDGGPYRVFTPYQRRWREVAGDVPRPFPTIGRLAPVPSAPGSFTVQQMRSAGLSVGWSGNEAPEDRLTRFVKSSLALYDQRRDLPAEDGTSKLSHHLALGSLSPRRVYWEAQGLLEQRGARVRTAVDTYIAELIWREFYYHILTAFPFVLKSSFKDDFRDMRWDRSTRAFERWKEGTTGYPIVDAGMRQLREEGWMHNRVRMIVGSFLTKDLHINWQWGEKYFAEQLIDLDLASNNGGWQWVAGTGTDASPWFRIFNPVSQGKRFDPEGGYVRRYVPELARIPSTMIHEPWRMSMQDQEAYRCIVGKHYPRKMVEHAEQRAVTILLYKKGSRVP